MHSSCLSCDRDSGRRPKTKKTASELHYISWSLGNSHMAIFKVQNDHFSCMYSFFLWFNSIDLLMINKWTFESPKDSFWFGNYDLSKIAVLRLKSCLHLLHLCFRYGTLVHDLKYFQSSDHHGFSYMAYSHKTLEGLFGIFRNFQKFEIVYLIAAVYTQSFFHCSYYGMELWYMI